MADDTRDQAGAAESSPQTPVVPAASPLPRGMILGKDGKPCRTCNTLASFTSQSKQVTKSGPASVPVPVPARRECPPDVEELGRSSWTLLHSLCATYPERPTTTEQRQVRDFMGLFAKLYPCWVCAEDFQTYLARHGPRTESRQSLGRWMCEAHNEVNRKLGKREFDCDFWQERWKTGPPNGSCG